MLHAFINLCHCILHPNIEWKVRPPVSIQLNSTVVDETTLSLAYMYLFFGLPVTGLVLELFGRIRSRCPARPVITKGSPRRGT